MLLANIPNTVVVTNESTEDVFLLELRVAVAVPLTVDFQHVPSLRKTALWNALFKAVDAGSLSANTAVTALTDGVYETDRLGGSATESLASLPASITVVSIHPEDLFIAGYRIPALGSLVIDTTNKAAHRTDLWYALAGPLNAGLITIAGLASAARLSDGVEGDHQNAAQHALTPADFP